MSSPSRLVLVRHAEPDERVHGRIYGRTDVGLSARGQEHARSLALMLARLPVAAVYTSPLRRAAATAAPLCELLSLPAVELDELRELDFGELEGLSLREVAETYPDLLGWTAAPASVVFPGGEGVESLRERSLAAVRRIRALHPGETAVLVSHAVVIRAIVADALEMDPDEMFRLDQIYGGISVVDDYGERRVVRRLNATSLEGPLDGGSPEPGAST